VEFETGPDRIVELEKERMALRLALQDARNALDASHRFLIRAWPRREDMDAHEAYVRAAYQRATEVLTAKPDAGQDGGGA